MSLLSSVRPYLAREALGAFFVGVSSGFPYAMIGATLTTRLAQDGIDKKTITAFALAFLVYNLKVFWAWIVDSVRLPGIGRYGQRVSWLWFAGLLVIAAVVNLALVDPQASLQATIVAAELVGMAGATYDIVIDAYRTVSEQGNRDFFAKTGQGLVCCVVDHLLDDVQRVVGAGVHAGPLLDRLESLENAYRTFGIFSLFTCHGARL